MSAIRSGRSVRGTERSKTDVVVSWGPGAGGAAAAPHELARNAGFGVTVLEAGHARAARGVHAARDGTRIPRRFYVDQGAQGPADGSIAVLQGRMVGGSTVINGEVCFRIPDFVLESWASEHGARGLSVSERDEGRLPDGGAHDPRDAERGSVPRVGKALRRRLRAAGPRGQAARSQREGLQELLLLLLRVRLRLQAVDLIEATCPHAAMKKGAVVFSEARVEKILMEERQGRRGARAHCRGRARGEGARRGPRVRHAIETSPLHAPRSPSGGRGGRPAPRPAHPVVSVLTAGTSDEQTEYRSAMLSRYSDAFIRDGLVIELFPGRARRIRGAFRSWLRRRTQAGGARPASIERRRGHHPRRQGRGSRAPRPPGARRSSTMRSTRRVVERVRQALKTLSEIALASGCAQGHPLAPDHSHGGHVDRGLAKARRHRPGTRRHLVRQLPPAGELARLGRVTDFDGAVRGARDLYIMDEVSFERSRGRQHAGAGDGGRDDAGAAARRSPARAP